jgi:hypothetical protein
MWHMSEICSPFSCLLVMSSFASTIVFTHFFTWIALGDVDLCFLLMFVRKASAIEEETMIGRLYHQYYQSIHVTDMSVLSLSASLLQNVSADMDHLCQIVLTCKLSHKLGKLYKYSSHVKANCAIEIT